MTKITNITTSILIATILLGVSGFSIIPQNAFADPVTILNPSFEDPAVVSPPGTDLTNTINNWEVDVEPPNLYIGVWYPNYGIPQFIDPMPDGNQAAFNDGGSICQTTTESYAPDTLYTLSVMVGNRSDAAYLGDWKIELQRTDGVTPVVLDGKDQSSGDPGPGR